MRKEHRTASLLVTEMEVKAITQRVDIAWTIQESEGALMIIEHSAVFGCLRIIIFQLTEWIAIVTKSSEAVLYCNDMLGFFVSCNSD